MPPSSDQDERRPGPANDSEREQALTPAEKSLAVVLAVDWTSPSIIRDRVRTWLLAHHWSPAQVDDLVLAVNEAVTNSIEHGYGLDPAVPSAALEWTQPPVEVHGEIVIDELGRRRVELVIRDGGGWRPPTADPTRGNGVTLMRACTDTMTISPSSRGTTVRLLSRPLPSRPDLE